MRTYLAEFLDRNSDRRITRPAQITYWINEKPPWPTAVGLALQHLAIQSVYFVIPAVVAGSLSSDTADATRFLSLSILAAAIWQILQLLVRGPVGSGYPIPGTHTAALIGAYALTGQSGGSFASAGAMLILAALASVLLTFLVRRLRVVLPNEVAGVVVVLIGVALVVLGTQRLGLGHTDTLPHVSAVIDMFFSLAVMVAVALSRTRAAPFAVLLGTLAGVPLALAMGDGIPHAQDLLAQRPWLAWPQPWLPRFQDVAAAPVAAFFVALVAIKATAVGSMVVIQRSSDASWSRPDPAPIRRGLLANALAMLVAGLVGGACPGPATAAVGLSIATGTLARRIVQVGAGLLVAIAFSPKLVAMFVLMPEPIKAAMLLYVAGFIMAQSSQLVTARLLDTRRTLIVAFGLCAGIAEAIAPQAFNSVVPALASPLSIGALAAFLINLVTLPLVARRAVLQVGPQALTPANPREWLAQLAASWALKHQTARAIEQAIPELLEVLEERGSPSVTVTARLAEDRVEVTLGWTGEPLPDPPRMASVDDLVESDALRQRFAVWLATRQSQGFRQRNSGPQCEVWLAFDD